MTLLKHPIKVVARRTGLTAHVIRIWEKRYGAVTPQRTDTNRRLYTDAQIERLALLRQATAAGHNISQASSLGDDDLRRLISGRNGPGESSAPVKAGSREKPEDFLDLGIRQIGDLDSSKFEATLARAAVRLGSNRFLNELVVPLTQRIGDLWETGRIKIAHEHFASSIIRSFLASHYRPFATPETAPLLVVATPTGQLHELGAVLVCAAATNQGWRVTYFGSSMPAVELAGAALQNKARAVALSIVYPQDDPLLAQELRNLRRCLPGEIALLVGGRAAPAYDATLREIGARRIDDLKELTDALQRLRQPSPSPS